MFARHRNNSWLENPFSALVWGIPFGPLDRFRREINHELSRDSNAFFQPCFECALPSSSFTLKDNGSEFVMTAQVPGLTEKDLDVTVTSDRLTVRGKRQVQPPEGYVPIREERSAFSFDRSVQLPVPVDSKRVEAKLTDGTLTVTLPKAEAVKPNRISVLSA